MTAAARVALVVDNTRTHKQRSKRSAPTQSFLTASTLSTAEKQKSSEPSRAAGTGTFACGLARKVSKSNQQCNLIY